MNRLLQNILARINLGKDVQKVEVDGVNLTATESVIIGGNEVVVDGQVVQTAGAHIVVNIVGNVDSIQTGSGDVTVEGDVHSIKTGSGDINMN